MIPGMSEPYLSEAITAEAQRLTTGVDRRTSARRRAPDVAEVHAVPGSAPQRLRHARAVAAGTNCAEKPSQEILSESICLHQVSSVHESGYYVTKRRHRGG